MVNLKSIGFLLLVLGASAQATVYPFERYQAVIDRKPFGEPPPPPPPAPENPRPTGPVTSFADSLRLFSIEEMEQGDNVILVAGIEEKRDKSMLILREGEIQKGIELVSADYIEELVILRKGTEQAELRMNQTGPATTDPTTEEADSSITTAATSRRSRRTRTPRAPKPPSAPIQPKYTGEELKKHLQDYQMEVIRQGLPPLPIPLTPEQDDQLVREGILPALQ